MSDRVIGLDLGSANIKAVQVQRHADGTFTPEKYATVPTPAGTVFDGQIDADEQHRVVDALREMLASADFDTKNVIVGYASSSSVFLDEITLPWVSKAEAAASIPNLIEAANPNLTGDGNEVDWTILGPVPGDPTKMRVVVYSVRTDYARALTEAVTEAGLSIVGADLSILAALRAVSTIERPAGQADAIVDIGADITSILLHSGGAPRFLLQTAESGGRTATAEIAAALGIDEHDPAAEIEKRHDTSEFGIVAQARDAYTAKLAKRVASVVASYVFRSHEFSQLASVTLVGGGSKIHGIGNHLNTALGSVPLLYAQLDDRLPEDAVCDDTTIGCDYVVATGLAMGARL